MIKEGTIFSALSGFYYVMTDTGTVECRARGRFRLEKTTPLVGDKVQISVSSSGKGTVETIYPRKNSFQRPPVANIDQMVMIASDAVPVTDPYLIDRVAALCELSSCECIICINKCDLASADDLYEIYTAAGYRTFRVSAESGEGIEEFKEVLKGKLSAFTGNSGVGKSSLINAIDPDFRIATGSISKKLGRGRHTTRHVELFKLSCGGIAADTPGFSSLEDEIPELLHKDELQYAFREFAPHLGQCRYNDCAHLSEPGCAVTKALEAGTIPPSRYASYKRLYEQAKNYAEWELKPRA